MRTIKLYIVGLILIQFSACQDILDTAPITENTLQDFYKNEKELVAALAGVYDRLGKTEAYGNFMLGIMGLDGDEAYYRRTLTTSTGVEIYKIYSSDNKIAKNWSLWYDGINRANLLLENIDRVTMSSEELRASIKGEALFLRGYYHFMLVKHWGDVPIKIRSTASHTDIYAERRPVSEVYEQIVKDMIEAETLVKGIKSIGHGGRVSKSAVRGILARVYMHWAGNYSGVDAKSKFVEARNWAYKLMTPDSDGFKHSLNKSYEDVFINHCTDKYDINESIWEVEFYGNSTSFNGFNETGRVGSNNGIFYNGDDNVGGGTGKYIWAYGDVVCNARTWYTFDNSEDLISKDERRDWSISNYTIARSPAVETAEPLTKKVGRYSGKWRRELEVVSPKEKNSGPINYPLLRYSDVLLMFAEAENEINNGPTSAAINAVNEVRERAYGKLLPKEVVRYINISNAGSGYTVAPEVIITGGGGTGVEAKAFIYDGKLTRIKVINQGLGYTSAPTVQLVSEAGTGSGGVANAIISSRLTSNHTLDESKYGTYSTFKKFIEDERLRELCFEGLRKGDLTRWGKFVENMNLIKDDYVFGDGELGIPEVADSNHAGLKYATAAANRKNILWPIPMYEMSLNRGLKYQNYGY